MRNKQTIFLLLALIALSGCDLPFTNTAGRDKDTEENTLPCGVEDPLNDLVWLREIKQYMEMNMGMAGGEIIQYTYEGNIYFWVDKCYRCPDNLVNIYNCLGQTYCQVGGPSDVNTCPDFRELATETKVLYSSVEL